jgi:hypothetical protein
MTLSYEQSFENYNNFHKSIFIDMKENDLFIKYTEVMILDQLLSEELISPSFHKLNLQRCIRLDKDILHRELADSMFFASVLITFIYFNFVTADQYPLFNVCMIFYLLSIYYLSFKYYGYYEDYE